MSAQFSRSSWARRDFPMPGSPTSSTRVPKPIRTGATGRREDRPLTLAVDERQLHVRCASRSGRLGKELAEHERLDGLALPLDRERLELGRLERAPPPRASAPAETQISSSPARAIRRAASAAVSPRTVYVRRKLAPTWPVNTRPSLTPTWTGSGRPASTMARTVRSIRSSSSPNVCGAPETRMIRPPSRSTSLSRNVTRCSSAAAWTARTRMSSASAAASGPSVAMISSVPEKRMNAIAACRCSPSSGPTSRSWARSGAGRDLDRDAFDVG